MKYNKELLDRFLTEKVAIALRTQDEWDTFMELLEKETDLTWEPGVKPTEFDGWEKYKEETSIIDGRFSDRTITFDSCANHEELDYKIVEFKELIEDKKMKRIDVMVDIETLGRGKENPILQIGAIAFDIETGKHLLSFQRYAKLSNSEVINGETLAWWLKTDKELLAELVSKGTKGEEEVMKDFLTWIEGLPFWTESPTLSKKDIYLWGNGILFDNKIIQGKCELYNLEYPIHYRNDRDVRTLVELYQTKTGGNYEAIKKSFHDNYKEHDALEDCKSQIDMVVHCYNEVIKST